MFQITILLSYLIAAAAFACSRLERFASLSQAFLFSAVLFGLAGLAGHAAGLWTDILVLEGLSLSLADAASFVGLLLALIALVGALDPPLRGMSAALFLLAGLTAALTGIGATGPENPEPISWQLKAHVLISLFAYGLLTVGAIVAVYALAQDRRLRSARLSPASSLFAPLETTEKLLFGIATAGFAMLAIAVVSGLAFVDNLFAQHLVHKTVLTLVALVLFGVLLAGRRYAGWRGRRAIYLYLWGFAVLGLAYFGSRYVLENVLGRTWG